VCVSNLYFGNITWRPAHKLLDFLTSKASCDRLRQLNYKRIYFIGDSYTRHIYQAFLLMLSGDYDYGSLNRRNPQCKGNLQFKEKHCADNDAHSKPIRTVCNNAISLAFFDVFNFKFSPDKFPYKDFESLLIWSEGSHPPLFNYSVDTTAGRNVRFILFFLLVCLVCPIEYIYISCILFLLNSFVICLSVFCLTLLSNPRILLAIKTNS
jgi:hypothetical protein